MYDPKEIEKKWITYWETNQIYVTPGRSKKPKSYVLGMFPYPSGEGLHVGHGRIFTAVDVIARYQRMKGYDVLAPMGWDAFGLPAENAAIKAHKNPMDMVPHNEANFKRQMMSLGLSYDWDRAFSTTDPAYYKWTQWLFLKLYSIKNDKNERLIYRKEVPINWCPFCKTGLANEEVQADGTHERCGTAVTQKLMPQWNMRITDYADRLLSDLKGLDWPGGILTQQRNWIGKKEGVVLYHTVDDMNLQLDAFSAYPIWCFADTFVVMAPEHPLVVELVKGTEYEKPVLGFVKECADITVEQRTEDRFEKRGVFTGRYVSDPFNPGSKMPVWVANFAMMGFGTGIIRCSAHDPRDYEFAQKYDIPLKEVVDRVDSVLPVNAHTNEGLLKDSGPFSGKKISPELIEEAKQWIVDEKIGRKEVTYHLRDWVFSRQRYWGEPFPLVYCSKCGDENGVVPLPDEQLPLTLPYLESYEPTETGESPLSRVKDWVEVTCPKCGGGARRETDTMPNWAGSCWYFLRFADPHNANEAWNQKAVGDWLPVDWYLGGAEHAVLHLLYARFWTKVFKDLKLIDFEEPFLRLRSVGMVLAADGKKMSKSLGNVVNPDDVVKEYGADAVRIYEMFMGPWSQTISWNPRSLIGCRRFVEKIWNLVQKDLKNRWDTSDKKLARELDRAIGKIGDDIVLLKFNTAIATLMKFSNAWEKSKVGLKVEDVNRLLLIMAPLIPFTAEELWEQSGNKGSIHRADWPEAGKVVDEEVTIVVQVGGKTRGTIKTQKLEDSHQYGGQAKNQSMVEKTALEDEKIKKWVEGKKYKTIFVPGRLVNFVIEK